jgi:acetolactate synthase-1/2/3 large subunit
MHQEREFPGRVIGTDLNNPDFAALAKSYGALGLTVNATGEFADAFQQAVRAKKPTLIHIRMEAEAISPTTTIAKLREARN